MVLKEISFDWVIAGDGKENEDALPTEPIEWLGKQGVRV